jgi:hypothetical protein
MIAWVIGSLHMTMVDLGASNRYIFVGRNLVEL